MPYNHVINLVIVQLYVAIYIYINVLKQTQIQNFHTKKRPEFHKICFQYLHTCFFSKIRHSTCT